MCDLKEGFKLCTCSGELKDTDPNWTLSRLSDVEQTRRKRIRKGLYSMPPEAIAAKDHAARYDNSVSPELLQKLETVKAEPAKKAQEAADGQAQTEFLLTLLHKRNCFDFNYIPTEGDSPLLEGVLQGRRVASFKYSRGSWNDRLSLGNTAHCATILDIFKSAKNE
jgi:hypothetical protein